MTDIRHASSTSRPIKSSHITTHSSSHFHTGPFSFPPQNWKSRLAGYLSSVLFLLSQVPSHLHPNAHRHQNQAHNLVYLFKTRLICSAHLSRCFSSVGKSFQSKLLICPCPLKHFFLPNFLVIWNKFLLLSFRTSASGSGAIWS